MGWRIRAACGHADWRNLDACVDAGNSVRMVKPRKARKEKRQPPVQQMDFAVALCGVNERGQRLERTVTIRDFDPRRAAKAAEMSLNCGQDEASSIVWAAEAIRLDFVVAGRCARCGCHLLETDRFRERGGKMVCDACDF